MKNTGFYGWKIVMAAAIILALTGPAVVALANTYQLSIMEAFGISAGQFTIANVLLNGAGIFLAPLASNKLAEGNFRRIQLIAIIIFGLAYMAYGLAGNIWVYYLLSAIIGVANLFGSMIPMSMMVTNWFLEKRGLAISLAMSGLGIGGFLLSPLVNFMIENWGWRISYMVHGSLILIFGILLNRLVIQGKPADVGMQALGAEEADPAENQARPEVQKAKGKTPSFEEAKTRPFFYSMLLAAVLLGIFNNGALSQFPPAIELEHGPGMKSFIISLYSIVGVAGKLVLGAINDRFGVRISTIYGYVLYILAFILMLFSGQTWILYLMAFFFGMGNAIGSMSPPLITASVFSGPAYGKAYGYIQSATTLGMTLGALVAASIAQAAASYNPAWLTLAATAMVSLICWLYALQASKSYKKL